MKKRLAMLFVILTLFPTILAHSEIPDPHVVSYGDLTLKGDILAYFNETWDLTSSPLVINFDYNGEGILDDQCKASTKIGLQDSSSGSKVWLLLDYDDVMGTFDPDPSGSPVWDADDTLFLQKKDGDDESDYDPLPSLEDSWIYPVYFDRDGVTPHQALNPLLIDGATYNTQGEYEISLIFEALNDTHGFAYAVINDLTQRYVIDDDTYPPPETLPDTELIVDDPEGTFIGNWYLSTLVPGYYGDGYRYNRAGEGMDKFTWTFDLPYSGEWEVSAIWSNRTNRASNSPYLINHAEGFDIVRVNQEVDGGQWNTLGTYTFDKGETTVTLSDDADQVVIADAIKMELKELSWPIVHTPAGLTFAGDMRKMQIFYMFDGSCADHVVKIHDLTAQGCPASLRERKELTIQILNQTHSEEKKIEHRIDKMIVKIAKSLDIKLWLDEYDPTVKHGHKVFDNEKKAIKHGMKIIKDKKTTEDIKETVMKSIDELISVDLRLAENLYEEASQYGGAKKVDHELEKAQKYLAEAYEELEKPDCKYDKVVKHLKKSWEHSQKAIKHAEKLENK